MKRPVVVFVSYKHQDDARNAWVHTLYEDLRARGIDAKLDIYEVAPGESFSQYMTRAISKCDFMLFIVTPASVKSIASGKGALTFEIEIANARRMAARKGFTIIPILREGEATGAYFADRRYIDFRLDHQYASKLRLLILWLTGKVTPPPLGGDVNASGFYSGPETQESIEAALKHFGRFRLSGFPQGEEPAVGGKGLIATSGESIAYIRTATRGEWDIWEKDYYDWDLSWDAKLGLTVTRRSACSPA